MCFNNHHFVDHFQYNKRSSTSNIWIENEQEREQEQKQRRKEGEKQAVENASGDKRDTLVCLEHKGSSFKTRLVSSQNSINKSSATNKSDEKTRPFNSEKLQSFTTNSSGKQTTTIATTESNRTSPGAEGRQGRVSPLNSSSCIAHCVSFNNPPSTTSASASSSNSCVEYVLQDSTDSTQHQQQHHFSEQTKHQQQYNKKSSTTANNTTSNSEYLTEASKQNKSLVIKKALETTYKEDNLNYANKFARKNASFSSKTLAYNDLLATNGSNALNPGTTDASLTTTIRNSEQNNDVKCKCCNIKSAPNLYKCSTEEVQNNLVECPWCSTKKSHSFANHSSLDQSDSSQNVCCNCCCGCTIPISVYPFPKTETSMANQRKPDEK